MRTSIMTVVGLEQQSTGVIICASNGIVLKATVDAARLLGSTAEDLVNSPLPFALQNQKLVSPEGTHIQVRVVPIEDCVCVVLENITEQEIRRMQVRQTKINLIGMVSHELRSPLATIRLNAELLLHYRERISAEKLEQNLHTILTKVDHMSDLLEDILNVSHAEEGHLRFHPTAIDLKAFCQEVVDEQAARYPQVTCDFHFEGTSGDVVVDKRLMHHILANLVSNAAKYSGTSSTVFVRVELSDALIRITVKDNGPGMPADMMARLFEPFYRGYHTAHIPGTGLGMAIVKRSVDTHQGTIQVNSELGQGTEVVVTLPRVSAGS